MPEMPIPKPIVFIPCVFSYLTPKNGLFLAKGKRTGARTLIQGWRSCSRSAVAGCRLRPVTGLYASRAVTGYTWQLHIVTDSPASTKEVVGPKLESASESVTCLERFLGMGPPGVGGRLADEILARPTAPARPMVRGISRPLRAKRKGSRGKGDPDRDTRCLGPSPRGFGGREFRPCSD